MPLQQDVFQPVIQMYERKRKECWLYFLSGRSDAVELQPITELEIGLTRSWT
jgi:hypothetical protein